MDIAAGNLLRDALVQVADGLSDTHDDLRAKFKSLFDQMIRKGDDKPPASEPERNEGKQERDPGEDHLAALSDFANAIIMASSHDDLEEPWRRIFNRLGWEMSEHVGVLAATRDAS